MRERCGTKLTFRFLGKTYGKRKTNALAASYRADLLYYIERAKLGKCPPHWQAYCFGEIADAKGTDNYPLMATPCWLNCSRLVDTVPQITNRDENVAEIAAYRGRMLFYFDRDYYTLAELVHLPGKGQSTAPASTLMPTAAAATALPTRKTLPCRWMNGADRTISRLISPPSPPARRIRRRRV